MFKQLMSDFAFNRAMAKTRKFAKQDSSVVVASLLETQAKKYYTGYKATQVENLLKEVVTNLRKEIKDSKMPGSEGCLDFESICLSCAIAYAVIEKDVDEDFSQVNSGANQVKTLVNLKLLPESFLSIEFDDAVA